jgi:prevent-host-death family protein
MTKSVGVHEAKTQLSRLLDAVHRGEEVIITRRGEEVARLVPPRPTQRNFGVDKGVFTVPDEFDNALPDEVLSGFDS